MPYETWIVVFVLVVGLLASSIRIASEWQRAVVLRLGRFRTVGGPGLFLLVPLVDRVAAMVDLRVQTSGIAAEQALTRDTVAVAVDAIVFWQVENPKDAALAIADYRSMIESVSQTSLREMIGASELGRLLSDRHAADAQLQSTIASKVSGWGIAVRSVEIRDVIIPAGLQDAMSRQAQAERERDARVTLASAERLVAEQVRQAADVYAGDPLALTLRQMNLLYEMNKERGATVLIPTELVTSFGRLAAQAGTSDAAPTDPA